MLDWGVCAAVERSRDKPITWVFHGTCVPVRELFEHLQGGGTIEQYLAWQPKVARWQIELVLKHAAYSASAA